jgi:DnaK suppressor protein
MKYFTIEQRENLEAELKMRAVELRGEILAALHRAGVPGAALRNHHEEVDDAALAELQQTLDVAELERDARELKQVKDAMRRLHTPDYGVCVDCGAEIPYSRLAAQPAAVRCVACQRLFERSHASDNPVASAEPLTPRGSRWLPGLGPEHRGQ